MPFLTRSFAMLTVSLGVCAGMLGCESSKDKSISHMRSLCIAIVEHGIKHDAWPEDLSALKGIDAGILENPLTGDNPGYEYIKPVGIKPNDVNSQWILLYQLRGGQRAENLLVCCLDGAIRPKN